MAQRKPDEKVSFDQVLNLVNQLSPDEQKQLVQQIKYQELRRDIQIGIDQANIGELFSEEEVLAQLKAHDQELREAGNK